MKGDVSICLNEWERLTPENCPALVGLCLEDEPTRALAAQLGAGRRLEIVELARGLEIASTSFVGSVQVGRLSITVQPKLSGTPLLILLRYAYGLRQLDLLPQAGSRLEEMGLEDVLIAQLVVEVSELAARGLHRRYERRGELLSNPRGRLDFQRYVQRVRVGDATLPCIHHPRRANTLINQILVAGLQLSVLMTRDLQLRGRLRRLIQMLGVHIEQLTLNSDVLKTAARQLDRQTVAYEPAFQIIRLLMQMAGLALLPGQSSLILPGFLFDMNRFFQALLSRFLHESLVAYQVQDEVGLRAMFEYVEGYNPRGRRSPRPRPDYVVLRGDEPVAVLDAKYRDLWEHRLPRDMLYQLAIYALSHQAGGQAAILYPTMHPAAREQRLVIREAVRGEAQARVMLRPVNLNHLAELVAAKDSHQNQTARESLANRLVFGETVAGRIQEASII